MNRQIRLKSRPEGTPSAANFDAVDAPMPRVGDGDVLRRTLFLSLDPYMRGRMSYAPSYAAPVEVGATMCGHTVSEVVESRNPAFKAGDAVYAYLPIMRGGGYAEFAIAKETEMSLKPKNIDFEKAAAVPLAATTAWQRQCHDGTHWLRP